MLITILRTFTYFNWLYITYDLYYLLLILFTIWFFQPEVVVHLPHIKTNYFLETGDLQHCRPFIVGDRQVGLVQPNVLEAIRRHPEAFWVDPASDGGVWLHPQLQTYDERSHKVRSYFDIHYRTSLALGQMSYLASTRPRGRGQTLFP